uniref:T-box domain-containing protein n=1 Tax=Monodelphis domestica TaxID=13616 RepID=A0A5F8GB54_MONDO
MPEAKKYRTRLRDRQRFSSDQPDPGSSLSTRGAESTCRPNDDSSTEGNRVAQGILSASCPGLLQPAQNDTAPKGIDPGSCQDPPGSEANGSLGPRLDAQNSLHIPGTSSSGKLKVRLCNHALWLQFSRQQNEMILSKQGRNMFPFLVYKIQGMDPSALYHVFIGVKPVDKHHWRYQKGQWLPLKDENGEDKLPGNRFYQHPDSPNTGAHWMDREIAFKNLKLTNKETACKNGSQAPILLKSLHKYQPRLHIEEVSDASFSRHNFTFPDTEFITVTAYQNPGIRRLKIQNNPFASGFRRKPSCPGESLQKSPPAGECSGSTSSPTALLVSNYPLQVQQGPGQEKDCDFMCGSQSPSGQLYETSDSRSTTSLVLPLTGEGLNPDLLPCTSQNDVSYHPSTDTPITQGNWSCSLSNCTSNENGMECFNSPNAMPQKAGTQSEEEERLQDQLFSSSYSNLSDVSNLGQRPSKKRCLSPVDSDKYSSTSAWKTREQEKGLGASESSGNNFHEAVAEGSCYPVVLQEDTDQTKEMMNPTSGNSIQETQSPSELPSDSIDMVLHAALCDLFPDSYPPAMANDHRPGTHITQGNWSSSLSNSTSNGNGMESLQSGNAMTQQGGIEEEEKLQEALCPSIPSSPSDVSHLGQRPSKKRCLSPLDSAKDSSASAWKTREQENKYLGASESTGNNTHYTILLQNKKKR